jgi:predicted AAA+ superfamily ATPase
MRKVLIMRGARQVGKTSLIRKFGTEQFEMVVEINMDKKRERDIFQGVVSIEDFARRLDVIMGKTLVDGSTLLFIDEIQESGDVLALLRFFAEERPGLHVIAAGSLLEVEIMSEKWNVPVGRVEYVYLYPLTFFEYLAATGESRYVKHLTNVKIGESVVGQAELKKLFFEYMMVGGLPEAVENWRRSGGKARVDEVHSRIIATYGDDVGKYASSGEKKYLVSVLDVGPRLAGKLFNYQNMGELGYGGREVGEAVRKLEVIRLLTQVKAINSTVLPIVPKYKRPKKMIWLDVGLVNHILNVSPDLVTGTYKGVLMEQVVGQTMIAQGQRERLPLYYWGRERDEGSAEVDFVWQWQQKLIACEVKAGNGQAMKSMFSMIQSDQGNVIPIRVSWDPLGIEGYKYSGNTYTILSIPFYLLERWEQLVEKIL